MASLFDEIYRPTVVPALMGLLADSERWKYRAPKADELLDVAVHAGNIEIRTLQTLEREKKVRQRLLVFTTNPDDEDYPGLASVHKNGVFESPDGESWSVVDEETDSQSGSLWRIRVQQAAWTKLDGYAER